MNRPALREAIRRSILKETTSMEKKQGTVKDPEKDDVRLEEGCDDEEMMEEGGGVPGDKEPDRLEEQVNVQKKVLKKDEMMVPLHKEHLQKNYERLNKALMENFIKKGKK